MSLTAGVQRLLISNRWANFLESTAVALHINLTVITPEGKLHFTTPMACPTCNSVYPELTPADIAAALHSFSNAPAEFAVQDGADAIVLPIKGDLCIVVRDCMFCPDHNRHPFNDRAKIAQELLTSFQITLNQGFEYGQRKVELSALHHMNQIILTLFREEDNALENAINLLLSASIILMDAEGSWLKYKKDNQPAIVIKGDAEAVRAQLASQNGLAVTSEVKNGSFYGELGVLLPAESDRVKELMPLLVQECIIIFEIEHLLNLLQTQLTMILGAVGSSVLLVNRYGNISYANEAAAKLFGETSLEMIGKPASTMDAPWTRYIEVKTNKRVTGQTDPVHRGADTYWLDWQLCPLRKNKTLQGWLILADDRTDHYRWQEAARQAERLAVTATLSGALAHELRNPLSAAKGLLQLMGRRRDPAKVKGYSDLVLKELERVTRLLNEFLLLGKPAELDPEPLDLAAFIEELLPLFEGETMGTAIEIKLNLERVPLVKADPGQLTQVVLNLVRNAIQAVGQNGCFRIAVINHPDGVVLEVRDSGPGLTSEAQERIFRPFFTTKERGTGLGLPIVQAIIHNHGGRIKAANAPGGGAVFTVILPAFRDEHEKVDVLLVIEDDILRYPAEQALRLAGIKVISTGNEHSLNELLILVKPQIIVLDANIFEDKVNRLIKELVTRAKVVILGQPGEMGEGVEYITRPLHYDIFINKIHYMLNE